MRDRSGKEAAVYWYLPFAWSLAFWDGILGDVSFVPSELAQADAEGAAELHGHAFAHAWSGDEFTSLLSQPGVFGYVARRTASPSAPPAGIVLARLAADEAEILTIVVDRAARGKGVGRMLMDQVLQRLHSERAQSLFLEVEEGNRAALSLYRRLRFEEVGRRPAYYAGANGERTSALVLKRTLLA